MVYFYQLFLNIDDVILKLYTSLCQTAKCTLFAWSTVAKPTHDKPLPQEMIVIEHQGLAYVAASADF